LVARSGLFMITYRDKKVVGDNIAFTVRLQSALPVQRLF
jgi:hypothetical protein